MMNERQIKEKINRLKEEVKILEQVVNTKSDSAFGRPIGSNIYSDEQTKFLEENKEIAMGKLVEMFNEKFNTNFKADSRALYNFMYRMGIIKPKFERIYSPRKPTTIDKIEQNKKQMMNEKIKEEKRKKNKKWKQ